MRTSEIASKNLTYSLFYFSNLFENENKGKEQQDFISQKEPAEANWFLLFVLTENSLL